MPLPRPDTDLLNAVIDSAVDGLIAYTAVKDSRGRIAGFRLKLANRVARSVLSEKTPVVAVLLDLLPDRAPTDVFQNYAEVAATGTTLKFSKTFEDSAGEVDEAWQFETCSMAGGVLVTLRDVTNITRRLRTHRKERHFLRMVSANASDLISLHDAAGFCVAASDAAPKLFDVQSERLIGAHLSERVHPADRAHLVRGERLRVPSVNRVRQADTKAGERWLEVRLSEQRDQVLAVTRDITKLRELEQRLEQLAPDDALTGLANRKTFVAQLENELHRRKRYGRPLSIVAIRAEGLSEIAVEYNTETQNRALKLLAEVTLTVLRNVDVAGRWTDGVFLLLLPETPLKGAERAAERLKEALVQRPVEGTSPPLFLTVSAGITDADWADDYGSILRRVGTALSNARRSGPGTVITERRQKAA